MKPNNQQPAEDIQAAYRKLAEGIAAVMELESTDVRIFNELHRLSNDLWMMDASTDQPGTVRWQLSHVAERQVKMAGAR